MKKVSYCIIYFLIFGPLVGVALTIVLVMISGYIFLITKGVPSIIYYGYMVGAAPAMVSGLVCGLICSKADFEKEKRISERKELVSLSVWLTTIVAVVVTFILVRKVFSSFLHYSSGLYLYIEFLSAISAFVCSHCVVWIFFTEEDAYQ